MTNPILISIALAATLIYGNSGLAATPGLTVLFVGTKPVGQSFQAPLTLASNGNFYSVGAGGNGNGTVYSVTSAGHASLVYEFSATGVTDGSQPLGVVEGKDGYLYGTASGGGSQNYGTVFKLSAQGKLAWAASLTQHTGTNPNAGVMQASDGYFYGTTYYAGTYDCGTIYRVTTAGAVTTAYNFGSNGDCHPQAALVQGSDGFLYGTTSEGGVNGDGSVFQFKLPGTYTRLHSFSSVNDGEYPRAALIEGKDGRLYGTAVEGGTSHVGTVFAITKAGQFTKLHDFHGGSADGSTPFSPVTELADGNYYGSTDAGGVSDTGTVYGITSAGQEAIVYTFNTSVTNTLGETPRAALTVGADGSVYSTTEYGGDSAQTGVVFKLSGVASAFDTSATPLLSPAAGTYASAEKVSITDTTPGATIYYTLNGTTPTTSSSKYLAPLTISKTSTAKALSVASGKINSAVASGLYTIK